MPKLTCSAEQQNLVNQVSQALGVSLPECAEVMVTETGKLYSSAHSWKSNNYNVIDTFSVNPDGTFLQVKHCLGYRLSNQSYDGEPFRIPCEFSWKQGKIVDAEKLAAAKKIILGESELNPLYDSLKAWWGAVSSDEKNNSLFAEILETIQAKGEKLYSDINENVIQELIKEKVNLSLIKKARKELQNYYQDVDPQKNKKKTPPDDSLSNLAGSKKALQVTSLFHLYLSGIIPANKEEIEKVLKNRTVIGMPDPELHRGHFVFTHSDGVRVAEHTGQIGKLLNFMIEDGILSSPIQVGEKDGKPVYLDNLALGYSAYLKLTSGVCNSEVLEESAWNLINLKSLSPSTLITPFNTNFFPFHLEVALEDIYEQLLLLDAPYENIPGCDSESDKYKKSSLYIWQIEVLAHGVMMYGSYLKAQPKPDSMKRMTALYRILIDRLEVTLNNDPNNLQKLGHYLEAIARTLKNFPEIEHKKDVPLLIHAANHTSGILVENIKEPIESTTHALMAVEILGKILS